MSDKNSIAKNFHWIPLSLSVLLILFVSVFALDVFGEENWFLGLLIHLIPTYFLIFLAVVAWKNDTLGGVAFIVIGLIFMLVSRLEGVIIYGPAIVLGLLFLLSGRLKKYDKSMEKPKNS